MASFLFLSVRLSNAAISRSQVRVGDKIEPALRPLSCGYCEERERTLPRSLSAPVTALLPVLRAVYCGVLTAAACVLSAACGDEVKRELKAAAGDMFDHLLALLIVISCSCRLSSLRLA